MARTLLVKTALLTSLSLLIPLNSKAEGPVLRGALIGGGVGLGLGGITDSVIAIVDNTGTRFCDHPPCKANASTATYVAIPLALGAVGAALGAAFGAIKWKREVAITPQVLLEEDQFAGGTLSFSKQF